MLPLKRSVSAGSEVSCSVLNEKIFGHWLCVHNICKYLPLSLSKEMKLSLCSPRRLWMGLSLSSPFSVPLSLSFYLTNIETNWHKHTALPFSNISCLLLFLWMHFNRYKNPHTHTLHTHRKTALFSTYKEILSEKCFYYYSWITQIVSSQKETLCFYFSFLWLSLCVFRYFHTICVHIMNQF